MRSTIESNYSSGPKFFFSASNGIGNFFLPRKIHTIWSPSPPKGRINSARRTKTACNFLRGAVF